ncbi:FAD:protein FMN transferase [Pseudobutyrivibrio ruminis]|uniref:FAD:protein FMN transferase n=1 Tax=Pseudobutyrivibrio ruminis TaxID=46206 RepID=UPI00051BB054|nr:FAD:protein FMN transferase [Pseudobutyrivibrio ruminis]
MDKKKIFGCLAIVVLIAFIVFIKKFGGDGQGNALTEKTKYNATFLDIFDTRTEIVGYADSEEEFAKMAQQLKDQLIIYNNLYDIYNDYEGINNIKTINDNAGVAPVEVDQAIIDMLKFSQEMYYETDGRVNIAMGSVLSIWHRHREIGMDDPERATLPEMEELQAAAEHTDINNLIIDDENNTVYLSDPEMSLDVGSTAKGYAVQKTLEYAREQGMNNILLSLGGNVQGIGGRIDGTNFKLGIQNPDLDGEQEYIKTVEIQDGQCVVSSGDYQRFYEVDGKVYCHIINPDTLFPSDTFGQVSILTDDSGMADAFSTAVYNMTLEEGLEFVNSHDGVEAMWVDHEGNIYYSDNFEESIVE